MHCSHGEGGFGEMYRWRCVNGRADDEKAVSTPASAEQDDDAFLGVEALIRPSVFSAPHEFAMGF